MLQVLLKMKFVGCYNPMSQEIKARKPDFVAVNKNERTCNIIDTAIPGDIRVNKQEKEKIQRYQELQGDIKRMRNIRSVKVIPLIVRTLGCTLKKLKNCTEELGVVISTALLQNIVQPETAAMLKVLDCR